MQSITLKNIPKKLHETLKRRAQMAHRSLNNEIIVSLETAVGLTPLDQHHMAFNAAMFQKTFKGNALPQEIDRFKKEGRA